MPASAISEIHITGNRRTPYRQVLEVLGMKPGQSIFSADLWSAQNRLARLGLDCRCRDPSPLSRRHLCDIGGEAGLSPCGSRPANAKGEAPITVVERNGHLITSHEVEKVPPACPKLVGRRAAPPGPPPTWWRAVQAKARHRRTHRRLRADLHAPLEPDPG